TRQAATRPRSPVSSKSYATNCTTTVEAISFRHIPRRRSGSRKRCDTPRRSRPTGVETACIPRREAFRNGGRLAGQRMLFACGASTVPATAKPEIALNRTLPLVLAVALFMEHMDSTVISTALPAIAADLGTSPVALKLALTAYLVSLAIFIPISGWMADRYGARRVFRTAIAVFIAGSVLCALSGSLTAFVASRFVQGMGGAMMTPLARLMLVRGTPRSDLVNAMAWLTVPALIGPMVGPPVGGFITTY